MTVLPRILCGMNRLLVIFRGGHYDGRVDAIDAEIIDSAILFEPYRGLAAQTYRATDESEALPDGREARVARLAQG